MGAFILRRLVQAAFTLFGVMLLTFVLFRLVGGDVTFEFVNPKLGKEARVAWLRKNQLDLPLLFNLQRRMVFSDSTAGAGTFSVRDGEGSAAVSALLLEPQAEDMPQPVIVSQPVQLMDRDTRLVELTEEDPWITKPGTPAPPVATQPATASGPTTASAPATAGAPASAPAPGPVLIFGLRDGSELKVDLSRLGSREPARADRPAERATCGELMRLIQDHPENRGRLQVSISELDLARLFDSQFFWHLWHSVTFKNRSYRSNELLQEIILKKARYSLAITVPTMAMGWFLAMFVSTVVAYYRGGLIDKLGVFLSVLGMCIPYLVYMLVGQWLIFEIAPTAAWGLHNRMNIYVPVGIAVVFGLGYSVRFYRTVILDEVSRDYVRTARAKGVPLYGVLYRHVLRNCMLPILTSLVVSIPFLIMGSLLLERFFSVPGLGGLMLDSVYSGDVPIISGLTFLTAAIYILGLLITDVLYAVFDPRIRLR